MARPTQLLVDTHCWLWMQVKPERFRSETLQMLERSDVTLFLSAASAWEMAIKYAIGKLPLPCVPSEYVPSRLAKSGTQMLPIEHRHALHVASLPAHHKDPFDRLLIAQSQLEDMPLLSADAALAPYDLQVLAP